MDAYLDIIKKSNVLIQIMSIVCGKLHSFEDQCNTVLDNMQNQLIELKENNNLFKMQKRSRSKRAPFEFMGSLYPHFIWNNG